MVSEERGSLSSTSLSYGPSYMHTLFIQTHSYFLSGCLCIYIHLSSANPYLVLRLLLST